MGLVSGFPIILGMMSVTFKSNIKKTPDQKQDALGNQKTKCASNNNITTSPWNLRTPFFCVFFL